MLKSTCFLAFLKILSFSAIHFSSAIRSLLGRTSKSILVRKGLHSTSISPYISHFLFFLPPVLSFLNFDHFYSHSHQVMILISIWSWITLFGFRTVLITLPNQNTVYLIVLLPPDSSMYSPYFLLFKPCLAPLFFVLQKSISLCPLSFLNPNQTFYH